LEEVGEIDLRLDRLLRGVEMILKWLVLALVLGYPQQESPKPADESTLRNEAHLRYEHFRQESIRMNELAGKIKSEADARAFVDSVADMFADNLPPAWVTAGIRERIAHAEFEAVSDPFRQISEQRIADVWNKYVREIGASKEAIVTVPEIHSMRDAMFATGQVMWSRGMNQSAWTMPNIYAVGEDGKVAEGCRAVEALRIFHDLDQLFDNLRGARERLRKGIVASDAIKRSMENTKATPKSGAQLRAWTDTNPLRLAEYRYVSEHGAEHLYLLVEMLFEELFPASQQASSKAPGGQ
jgi:hypothetical protein